MYHLPAKIKGFAFLLPPNLGAAGTESCALGAGGTRKGGALWELAAGRGGGGAGDLATPAPGEHRSGTAVQGRGL